MPIGRGRGRSRSRQRSPVPQARSSTVEPGAGSRERVEVRRRQRCPEPQRDDPVHAVVASARCGRTSPRPRHASRHPAAARRARSRHLRVTSAATTRAQTLAAASSAVRRPPRGAPVRPRAARSEVVGRRAWSPWAAGFGTRRPGAPLLRVGRGRTRLERAADVARRTSRLRSVAMARVASWWRRASASRSGRGKPASRSRRPARRIVDVGCGVPGALTACRATSRPSRTTASSSGAGTPSASASSSRVRSSSSPG